ncbi:pyridoxine biosynthesis isoform B [Chlorella sorokiniana]|uniref:pyridoxal 5'-phosphate synthase (glutamine hydrolyzing) n=1 Tax=Chlorella sorokiniana TaxID=3076 RepID=A0A2P6U3D0_CHLSO|nr:pyridoxine biosynthesis isoform B [Chlorella sorokiniana]|eukprot:PRW60818.1 pyridoxine biosynthesis isoform B [Chlorella sorokiniana]
MAEAQRGTQAVKVGLAQMLKGGVIMDVVTPEEARIAEEAGAVAVMALERVPADIRRNGGVARMSDPQMIKEIKAAVTIPVMAKARIGHFVEAQILEAVGIDYIDESEVGAGWLAWVLLYCRVCGAAVSLEAVGIDYIDESEVLTPSDDVHHINKHAFKVPFVCGCRDLGEALRRIAEGAAMIRTKGEAGTGNVVEAVRHARAVQGAIRQLQTMDDDELYVYAKELRAPVELVRQTKALGRLPVVNFAAGGVATPADAALMMQLGMDGVFVGSGIFKSGDPAKRARAIVQAVTHYNDPAILAEVSCDLGEPMVGIDVREKGFKSYAQRSDKHLLGSPHSCGAWDGCCGVQVAENEYAELYLGRGSSRRSWLRLRLFKRVSVLARALLSPIR